MGRANPSVLDKVLVDYYGAPTPVNQMAAVSVPEPRTLLITHWDKSTLKAIEKAIQTSDIGLNPQNDGSALRLNFPPLTEERRRELVKTVYKYCEEAEGCCPFGPPRRARQAQGHEKENRDYQENDLKDAEKRMQDLTDKFCKEIDVDAAKKEKEILEL